LEPFNSIPQLIRFNKLYIKLLGGGLFGKDTQDILGAIKLNIDVIKNSGLEVYVVS
jgi:hypothetical protein